MASVAAATAIISENGESIVSPHQSQKIFKLFLNVRHINVFSNDYDIINRRQNIFGRHAKTTMKIIAIKILLLLDYFIA